MTAQIPEDRAHIVDLLPAYLNGQLDAASANRVRKHLVSCATCRLELEELEAIKGAATHIFATTPLPSAQVMNQVWAQIDAEDTARSVWHLPLTPQAHTAFLAPARALRRIWQVFRAQIPLIQKSIWISSALVCLFGLILTFAMAQHTVAAKSTVANVLVLFLVVVGAAGSAFLSGSSVDPGFELTVSTSTSVRLVMLCRLAIVLGYNMLLGLLSSAVFAAVYGGSLWGFVQLWLGPMFFLSSLCLALSLFVGSSFALLCAAVMEILQTVPHTPISNVMNIPWSAWDLAPTSPLLLITALLLIAFAVFWVSRQPRLAS